MKKQLTTIFFIFVVMGCTAMAQNGSTKKISIYGEQILVRSYDIDKKEIIFGFGNPPGAPINPNIGIKRTTIAIRDLVNGLITKTAELPYDYRVYDAQIVSLRLAATEKPIDFCVFCGTRTESSTYSYYNLSGNLVIVTTTDSTGFVGLFHLNNGNSIPNPSFSNYVYIRDVEDTKHLIKLAAYAEELGAYYGTCGAVYKDNAVLDIVGLPANSINRASCITRVKFYPECNGSIRWDNNIRTPSATSQEIVTDIAGTLKHIVTVSMLPNDTQSIYLRENYKELTLNFGGLQLTNVINKLDLSNSTISTLPYDVYYDKPVRVTHLVDSDAVVSFIGKSTPSSSNSCDGLFSFRVDLPNIVAGAYDNTSGTLVDVCHYKYNTESVALIKLPTAGYQLNTLDWYLNMNLQYPVYSIFDTSVTLQSICTYYSPYGVRSLMAGGLICPTIDRQWKLLQQEHFNNAFQSSCFQTSTRNVPLATVSANTIYNDYYIYRRYPHDPTNYPMTLIPWTNTQIYPTDICP